jgi:hypothetical protein
MLSDFATTIKSTDSDAVITPKPITLTCNITVFEPGLPLFSISGIFAASIVKGLLGWFRQELDRLDCRLSGWMFLAEL